MESTKSSTEPRCTVWHCLISVVSYVISTLLSLLSFFFVPNILLGTKKKLSRETNLDIRYDTIDITQCHTVPYLGSVLDKDQSGESVALKVIKKIYIYMRLTFLYRGNKFMP